MQYNCISVWLSAAGFNTQAFTRVLCIMGHVLLSLCLPSSRWHETEVLLERQERPGLYLFFLFLIATYFLRFKFGFPSTDMEVSGQDPNWCCTAISAPAAQGAGVGTVGSACFAPT